MAPLIRRQPSEPQWSSRALNKGQAEYPRLWDNLVCSWSHEKWSTLYFPGPYPDLEENEASTFQGVELPKYDESIRFTPSGSTANRPGWKTSSGLTDLGLIRDGSWTLAIRFHWAAQDAWEIPFSLGGYTTGAGAITIAEKATDDYWRISTDNSTIDLTGITLSTQVVDKGLKTWVFKDGIQAGGESSIWFEGEGKIWSHSSTRVIDVNQWFGSILIGDRDQSADHSWFHIWNRALTDQECSRLIQGDNPVLQRKSRILAPAATESGSSSSTIGGLRRRR